MSYRQHTYNILNIVIRVRNWGIYAGGGTAYAVYIHARRRPHIAWRAEKKVGGE
jgi:hypothetical protein